MKALEHDMTFRKSLGHFVTRTAKNHLLSLARTASREYRPKLVEPESAEGWVDRRPRGGEDSLHRAMLREETRLLLRWLAENPEEVPHGRDVLNLLLWNHGDFEYVALAMTIRTRKPWTAERVRSVVRRIKETEHGRAMCAALNLDRPRRVSEE